MRVRTTVSTRSAPLSALPHAASILLVKAYLLVQPEQPLNCAVAASKLGTQATSPTICGLITCHLLARPAPFHDVAVLQTANQASAVLICGRSYRDTGQLVAELWFGCVAARIG